jgi:hypothetical protein
MSRGYLLFAVNSDSTDYVKLAYACALSIKLTQPEGYNNVSIVAKNINDISIKHNIFDHMIEYQGPEGMDVRSRGYDFTPYDETVLLDSDLLFLNKVDHYWEAVKDMEMLIATCPRNYRHQRFKYGYYRKVFSNHQLDDVYSAWTYFKKTSNVKEFFDTVKLLTDNAGFTVKNLLPKAIMTTVPTDEAFALALKITDIDAIRPEWPFPSITHMKGHVQGWHTPIENWTDKIRMTIDSGAKVKIGVWQQKDILHYVTKSLITDAVIKTLETAYEQP